MQLCEMPSRPGDKKPCKRPALYLISIPGPHQAMTPICDKCMAELKAMVESAKYYCYFCGREGVGFVGRLHSNPPMQEGFTAAPSGAEFRAGPAYGYCEAHKRHANRAVELTTGDKHISPADVIIDATGIQS